MIEDTLLLTLMHQKRFVVKLFHVTRSQKKVWMYSQGEINGNLPCKGHAPMQIPLWFAQPLLEGCNHNQMSQHDYFAKVLWPFFGLHDFCI
jgi:hypothetical protein